MFVSFSLPGLLVDRSILFWTVAQVVESALPAKLTCPGGKCLVKYITVGCRRNCWGVFLIKLVKWGNVWVKWKGIKRDFAQDILAQGCSLIAWTLVQKSGCNAQLRRLVKVVGWQGARVDTRVAWELRAKRELRRSDEVSSNVIPLLPVTQGCRLTRHVMYTSIHRLDNLRYGSLMASAWTHRWS